MYGRQDPKRPPQTGRKPKSERNGENVFTNVACGPRHLVKRLSFRAPRGVRVFLINSPADETARGTSEKRYDDDHGNNWIEVASRDKRSADVGRRYVSARTASNVCKRIIRPRGTLCGHRALPNAANGRRDPPCIPGPAANSTKRVERARI